LDLEISQGVDRCHCKLVWNKSGVVTECRHGARADAMGVTEAPDPFAQMFDSFKEYAQAEISCGLDRVVNF
jgi:hypothetical protein